MNVKSIIAVAALLCLSVGAYAMRPQGETNCTGSYYVFFDEQTDYTCIYYDEEGWPQNGQRTICNAALFSNCHYDNCCR